MKKEYKSTYVLKLTGISIEIEVDPFYQNSIEYNTLPKHKYFVEYDNPVSTKEVDKETYENVRKVRQDEK